MKRVVVGNACLYLGDCRDVRLPKIDTVITSPPYNQLGRQGNGKLPGMWNERYHGRNSALNEIAERDNLGKAPGSFYYGSYTDDLPEDVYQKQQNEFFSKLARVIADGGSVFYNHQIRWREGALLHPVQWFHPDGLKLRSEIIWARGGSMMLNAKMFGRSDERVLWFVKGKEYKWHGDSARFGTVWRIAPATRKDHPVAFPAEIPRRCILATTEVGDTVLDPYMGTGATGAVALSLGRKFVGVELGEEYFELAVARLRKVAAEMDCAGRSGKWLRDTMAERN